LRLRIEAASRKARELASIRGVFLEWLDPPSGAGHWPPDLLALAGIDDPLARAGIPSLAMEWRDVVAARPDLLILAPCGFNLERAQAEAYVLRDRIDSVGAQRVVVLDGSAYFHPPGPRLGHSLELLVVNR